MGPLSGQDRTPECRETWFQNHLRDPDGTELFVSDILLRSAAGARLKEIEALEKQAESIRDEITSGKLDFAAAAKKYSAGPSSKQGGRLGKIGRHGPMDESFSRAAFELKAGEISAPVRSPFGVHLEEPTCHQVPPGTKKLADLKRADRRGLGQGTAGKNLPTERQQTSVKYTSAWPHFKPGTRGVGKVGEVQLLI